MERLGIDIGGSSAKLAVCDPEGKILRRSRLPTSAEQEADELVRSLAGAVEELDPRRSLLSLGVAAPGCRREDGEGLVNVTNLPQLDGYPLRERLEKALGRRVTLDNDANAAALGEHTYGAGREARRLLVLTLGTGIGAGMVVEGAIHRVAWQGLGDPGHVIVQPDGPVCGCGGRGCVEALAAVPAIMRRAGDFRTFEGAVQAARGGRDAAAGAAFEEAGRWIGVALASLVHLLAPDRILLGGGGFDAAPDLLMEPVSRALRGHVQPFFNMALTLGRAGLGNDAGVLGAASLSG